MANYFGAKNENNKVTIDDRTTMLSLLRCGTLDSIASYTKGVTFGWKGAEPPSNDRRMNLAFIYSLTLNDNEKNVALAIPDDENIAVCTNRTSTQSVNVVVFRNVQSSEGIESLASKIKVYIFGEDHVANNKSGIQVYNAAGQLAFKSTNYLFDVKGKWEMSKNIYIVKCNSLPASFLIEENAKDLAVVCNAYIANWVKDPHGQSMTPYIGIYGISKVGTKLYAKLMVCFWFSDSYSYYNGLSNQAAILLANITNAPI